MANTTSFKIGPQGSIESKVCSFRSCIRNIPPTTWCTLSSIVLDCEFLIVVGLGLISKSCNNGMTSLLNYELLSNRTYLGIGYLNNQASLNNCDTHADDSSFSGTSEISNQPVTGSINVMAVSVSIIGDPFLSI